MSASLRGLSQPVQLATREGKAFAEAISWNRSEGNPSQRATDQEATTASNKVVGVVCSGDVAVYRDQVKATIERGKTERPNAVWVCFEPKSDRMTHDVMVSLNIEPVVLPLNDAWRRKTRPKTTTDVMTSETPPRLAFQVIEVEVPGYDHRRGARDSEMLRLCDELVIFHKRTGSSPWRVRAESDLYRDRLFVVELGEAPKPKGGKKR